MAAVLGFASPSHAQNQPPISCSQAIEMGFDKFVEAETARTKNYSTQGTIAACDHYTKCKRAANDRAIKVLSAARQKQVGVARRELQKLEIAIWTMVYIEAGGGTMYSQISAASAATREDVLGHFIIALRMAHQNASSRALKVLWTQADRALAPHLKTPTSIPGTAFGSPSEDRKRYTTSVREAQSALRVLKVLSTRLPSAAAKIIVERVAHATLRSFETVD